MRICSLGVLGGSVIANTIVGIAGKLRTMILLHFGLITFRIDDGIIRKPLIFMVLGPGGRDHDCQNQLFSSLETPRYFKKNTNNTSHARNILFWEN